MYYSKYNIFINDFPFEGGVTVYNLINKSLAYLDNKNNINDPNEMDNETLVYMKDNKIILNNAQEDFYYMEEAMRNKYNTDDLLEITIVTTQDCNLCCIYCFEGKSEYEYMSLDLCESIISLIVYEMRFHSFKKLHIRFYGGEPLLNMDVINCMNTCFYNKYHENYTFHVVTNGVLLNKDIISDWKSKGLDKIKITIDGERSYHDFRRKSKSGEGTYDKIIGNIQYFPLDTNNILHIVIDESNYKHLEGLLKDLKKLGYNDRLTVALSYTHPHINVLPNMRAKTIIEASKMVKQYGFVQENQLGIEGEGICSYKNHNAFLIDTDGKKYKCTGCLAIKNKEEAKYKGYNDKYLNSDRECLECKYIPICNGGCQFLRIYNNGRKYCQKKYFDLLAEEILKVYIEYDYS